MEEAGEEEYAWWTYPRSGYDLERVLQELGTGEAIVTVMSEKGAPTPVAWTRLRAPQGLMSPTPDPQITAAVKAPPSPPLPPLPFLLPSFFFILYSPFFSTFLHLLLNSFFHFLLPK